MKKLPEVNVVFEDLYRMLVTPIRSKLLLTGIERKVFNQLDIGRELRYARLLLDLLLTLFIMGWGLLQHQLQAV